MTSARRSESGVALIWAIVIVLIVGATITLVSTSTILRVDETRDAANRTRSAAWVNVAGDDLLGRVRSLEIGYQVAGTSGGNRLLTVPQTGLVSTSPSYTTPCGGPARPITNKAGSRAYYQVLPPAPGVGQCWQALQVRSPATPGQQGAIQVVVRVWEDTRRPEAIVARLTFRQTSITKFSILSNSRISLGVSGGDSIRPGGYIHTNNASGEATPIRIRGSIAGAVRITTSQGGISPGCGICTPNVRDVVEFGAASRAMQEVERMSLSTTPINYSALGIAQTRPAPPASPARTIPVWDVRLSGCGNGVQVRSGYVPVRGDTGGIPMVDDRESLVSNGGPTCVNIADVGGALLLDGDVFVRGTRGSNQPPVTILARRGSSFPAVLMDHDGDAFGVTADEAARVSTPASIYLVGNVGANSSLNPVGLVAEGGVYFPSGLMPGVNTNVNVTNVAAMAASAEVGLGPAILSIAADGIDPGLGLTPALARQKGYGYGNRLTWTGAIASSRPIYLRYGTQASYVGYGTRQINYANDFAWNPPPLYPKNRDWFIADTQEFR